MDTWLHIVIQQSTLYVLPVLMSMTVVAWLEARLCHHDIPHPFYAITSWQAWLPFWASIFFTRGMIISSLRPITNGLRAATVRALAHAVLMVLGFALYSWSVAHPAPTGLPPIHHWWAKVLMFYNLCMLMMHLLPLPNLCLGELLQNKKQGTSWMASYAAFFSEQRTWILMTVLAASPLLDISLGAWMVYPVYADLATWAVKI